MALYLVTRQAPSGHSLLTKVMPNATFTIQAGMVTITTLRKCSILSRAIMGPLNFVFDEIFNILKSHKGLRIGYEFEDSDEPVITHMIESSGVYQISP